MALNDRGSILQARNLNTGTFSIQFTGKKAGYFPTRFYIIATDGSCIMGCLYLSVEEDNRDMRTISSLAGVTSFTLSGATTIKSTFLAIILSI